MSDFSAIPASSYDAFADAGEFGKSSEEEIIHIRIQQRNGKKCVTTIQGLKHKDLAKGLKQDFSKLAKSKKVTEEDLGLEKLLKTFKKDFCCNGSVIVDSELGKVIQLQGDQRKKVSKFLIDGSFTTKKDLKIHGY